MTTDLLAPDRHVYRCYGEGKELFRWLDHPENAPDECVFVGQAGAGKTRLMAEWVVTVCNRFPDSKGLILRKTRVSLNDSALDILENHVLGPGHPAVLGKNRASRDGYDHPSLGGQIRLGGMDNPTKLFSTEYDWIWANEANELSQPEWESLHRALRRPSSFPFKILIGDLNPDAPGHHLRKRCINGTARMLIGRFSDNPRYFDRKTRTWTPEGITYTSKLGRNLSGVRRKRLYEGVWAGSEGAVWEDYDPGVHLVTGKLEKDPNSGFWVLRVQGWNAPVPLKWFCGGQDVGFTNPGVAEVFGFDADGRAYRVAEIMHTGKSHDWWAGQWCELVDKYGIRAIACDHDPAFISTLNKRLASKGHGMIARHAWKHRGAGAEKAGIDVVRVGFQPAKDGRPRIYLLRDARIHPADPDLEDAELPTCWEDEIDGYVYDKKDDGSPHKDVPDPKCRKDACDSARYALSWAWGKDLTPRTPDVVYPAGTYGQVMGTPASLAAEERKRLRQNRYRR